jgi:hypothetical protein
MSTKTETNRLVFIPLSIEENKISESFKKLAKQDGILYHDLLLEALQLVFVKHHLDIGGNPQRQILSFQQETLAVPKCKCGKDALKFGVHLPSKKEFRYCQKCFCEVPARHDILVWRWLTHKLITVDDK